MPLQKSNTEQAVEDCDKIKILNKELMAIIIIIIIMIIIIIIIIIITRTFIQDKLSDLIGRTFMKRVLYLSHK